MSQKRVRDPSDKQIGSPPHKKSRCSVSSDIDDHKEFIKYVDSIENSSINRTLQIPSAITEEISEYCIGQLTSCGNNKCNINICILNKDIKDQKNAEWIYCNKNDLFFCKHCKPLTKEYECGAIDMKFKDNGYNHIASDCQICYEPLCYNDCQDEFSFCRCGCTFCNDCIEENPCLFTTCVCCNDLYCNTSINYYYRNYNYGKICEKCHQFVCGKCLDGRLANMLPFDMNWNSLHCLDDKKQKEIQKIYFFLHYLHIDLPGVNNFQNVDFQQIKANGAPYNCPFCHGLSFQVWTDWKQHWYQLHNTKYFDDAKKNMKLNMNNHNNATYKPNNSTKKRNHTTMTNGLQNDKFAPKPKRQKISHNNNNTNDDGNDKNDILDKDNKSSSKR